MPERPDLRAIAGNIRDALGDCDRDALLDILTFVFKEYIVEGPPPLLINQAERLPDLEGLSFPQLIGALQTRLEHPELSLFQVEGDVVLVRVGGVLTPLTAPQGSPGATTPGPAPGPAPSARPAPGVRVVETDIVRRPPGAGPRRGDIAGMAREAVAQATQAESSAPPPRRGMSIRGRSGAGSFMPGSGEGEAGQPAAPAGQNPGQASQSNTAASTPANPPNPAPATEPEHPGDDDASSARFSLLELD